MSDKNVTGPEPTEKWTEPRRPRLQEVQATVEATSRDIEDLYKEVKRNQRMLLDLFELVREDNKTVTETVLVNPDSITVGAPTNGQIKVCGDFNKAKDFEKKIDTAKGLLNKATKSGE